MYIKRKVGGAKTGRPLSLFVGCGGRPSLPLVDGGGAVHGGCCWMVVVVVVWAPHCHWLMVVVPFVGGCSWPFVVGVGGWWWCSCRHVGGAGHSSSFVGGAAGRSTLVVCVVIGCRLPLVFSHRCSLFIVVHHCASFVSVVVIWRRFISCGDVATDVSGGLPIGEG